jgi:hypothetical protein
MNNILVTPVWNKVALKDTICTARYGLAKELWHKKDINFHTHKGVQLKAHPGGRWPQNIICKELYD